MKTARDFAKKPVDKTDSLIFENCTKIDQLSR